MGLLEPGDIFVYSLCWHTPQSWCAHLSCQVGQPGLMDTGTNCCMLKRFFSHFFNTGYCSVSFNVFKNGSKQMALYFLDLF